MRFPRGNKLVETYILQPWIKMGAPDIVRIPTHNIVVAVDVSNSALEQYKQYVEESSSKFSMYEESNTDDSRDEMYEKLMDSLLGDATEEEDDGNTRSNTTYH
jgi:hypothetical protein